MIRVFGTAYRLHPLFVLLMAGSVLTGYFVELLTLFGVVLIHELGHVAAAGSFGWRVREVKLLPFGGVAETEESSNVPAREEMLVALAGPLQNVWMAGFACLMQEAGWGHPEYWKYFLEANLMVGGFNLLPIWPLDGGRIIHAFVGYWISYHRTLLFTFRISLFLSMLLVAASIIRLPGQGLHMNLLLIGTFLLYSNWYSYKNTAYHFLRFLMARPQRAAKWRLAGTLEAIPLAVDLRQTPMAVFHRFMREQYHLICVLGVEGQVLRVVPEEQLIGAYLSSPDSHRTPPPPKNG